MHRLAFAFTQPSLDCMRTECSTTGSFHGRIVCRYVAVHRGLASKSNSTKRSPPRDRGFHVDDNPSRCRYIGSKPTALTWRTSSFWFVFLSFFRRFFLMPSKSNDWQSRSNRRDKGTWAREGKINRPDVNDRFSRTVRRGNLNFHCSSEHKFVLNDFTS